MFAPYEDQHIQPLNIFEPHAGPLAHNRQQHLGELIPQLGDVDVFVEGEHTWTADDSGHASLGGVKLNTGKQPSLETQT